MSNMEQGVIGCLAMVGATAVIFGLVFLGEFLRMRVRENKEALGDLQKELARVRNTAEEVRQRMEALSDHLKIRFVAREYVHKTYYRVEEGEE